MKYLRNIPTPVVMLLSLWAWSWGWWGDVLWTAHERSFFAFENELVQHVWSKSFGSLWLIGRALLTTCAWPWLGGLLMAVMLTGIACCLRYVMLRRDRVSPQKAAFIETLCLVPSIGWVLWLAYNSFDAYFKGEPGRIFGIPFLALVIVLLQATLVWSFRRRRRPAMAASASEAAAGDHVKAVEVKCHLIPLLFILCSLAAIIVWEKQFRPWTRPSGAMERAYAAEDWDRIREVALDNATVSCRPMAAYYAIALVRQDAIMKHLFDVRFEYDDIQMHDWNGTLMNSAPYYVAECDMHAGLLQFAYHKAIEDLTVDGPTVHNLKILTQVSAMRHEKKVCRKYLDVLARTPGNADFIERWTTYMNDTVRMEADATVRGIRQLEPVHDAFESAYTDPAFLGYNLQLYEGRSQQALLNSVAVCLYTKLVPPFLERAQYLGVDGVMRNPIVADALAMQAVKNPDILRALPQLQFNLQRYQGYVRTMQAVGATGGTEQRKAHADELFEGGRCYYPYYYFFGNLRATRKDAAEKYGYPHKAGVN